MKRYKYIFALIGLSMIGCSDLEEKPVGILAPESYFTSMDKVEIAVKGAYSYMANRYFMGRETAMTLMLRSDIVEISDPNTSVDRRNHNDLTDLANNGQTLQSWKIMYQIIAAANQAIAGAELVTAEASVKNPLIAQAYFARAFTYFHLVQQFGAIPYFDKPVSDVAEASNVTKTPVADVYANIIADLQFAKEWLPNTQATRALPAKSAASAYLASVYLTMGDYPNAYTEATDFISKKGIYNIELEADYQDLFDADKSGSSLEPIFLIDYIGDSSIGNYSTDYLVPLTGIRKDNQFGVGQEGWAVMVPSLKTYLSYNALDYRRQVSFNATAKFGAVDGPVTPYTGFKAADSRNQNQPYIAKYTRLRGDTPGAEGRASSQNYIMMRYAEVLLIAAEAVNEIPGGSIAEAEGYLNLVRARARSGGVTNGNVPSLFPIDAIGSTQATFRDAVLEERRIELAFEQKRWYDIVRRKLGPTVFGASGLEGNKSFTDANYLIAIPAEEVLRNPNLAL
ncbi:RagB/SusD family nutrient uptake outer membrane protein [Flavobacterium algicola]|uniref:RagB/SusD family nutrient uptake outer membrane protein n=1 Tax=Flavobacterium algicola TaxID=556529 RepID=UPI001EFE65E4|nr:RagB/SusD family nutrient uptake outer membrane protein [Flavobacterium algicola]MCG9791788.1 RagB/SusD family nutrient uptake outer membrane protein [Flavobacterium algicola]